MQRAEASVSELQLLNPMVDVTASASSSRHKDEAYFAAFDVVCLTNCSVEEIIRVNDICRAADVMFYYGASCGFYSAMFADLKEHEYAE